jgi:Ca2+-binding EF-hand superfamily protein
LSTYRPNNKEVSVKRIITVALLFLCAVSIDVFAFDFKDLDMNKDGKIDEKEYAAAIQVVIKDKFRQADKNHDGVIDKAEFARFTDITYDKLDEGGTMGFEEFFAVFSITLSEEFKLLDKGHKGYLDKKDLASAQFPLQPSVRSSLGKVVSIDKETKNMVVEVQLEGEFYMDNSFHGMLEYLGDGKNKSFDIGKAFFSGSKDIRKGDTVRLNYTQKYTEYRAYSVLKITAKQ